ncbi:hypothetical protein GCM10010372_10350 [Streptomyces tauricus]|nr:hypothetical protein GCM10010372_10350 [Streptomyces tauricus]
MSAADTPSPDNRPAPPPTRGAGNCATSTHTPSPDNIPHPDPERGAGNGATSIRTAAPAPAHPTDRYRSA